MDRRTGTERRTAKRYKTTLDIEWQDHSGRHSGTISDLSEIGCFVLTGGKVEDGEIVSLFLPSGNGAKLQFLGEVSNHAFEIGYAVRFVDPSPAHKKFLSDLLAPLEEAE